MEAVDRDGLEKEFSTQGDRALGKPTGKPEHTAISDHVVTRKLEQTWDQTWRLQRPALH